jgi:hypothetical protein
MTERSDTMPVIGRLDDQVEAVLINPLKRRPTPGEERRDESQTPPPSNEDVDTEPSGEARRKGRAGDGSLPVWML